MVHTRETRAAASEIKFLIDPALAPAISHWARTHLEADPHGSGPFGDEYETASLYFDTRRFDVFHRRGSFGRAKYRIRRYGTSDVVFLERKLRKPAILIKRRTIAPIAVLDHLQNADGSPEPGTAWFRQRLVVRRLRPVARVSYRRTARALDTADGPVRLTIDCDLRALPTSEPQFCEGEGIPFLSEHVILELKYRARLPAIFKRLVEDFALKTQTASKYRLGMSALGHVPASDEPAVLRGSDVSYA